MIELLEQAPVPKFDYPVVIGLGKTIELNGEASKDPDQVRGDGTGIKDYAWFARRSQPANGEYAYLGSGQKLSYQYSEESPFDTLGEYDVLLQVTDDEGSIGTLTQKINVQMDFYTLIFHGYTPPLTEATTQNDFNSYSTKLDANVTASGLVPTPFSTFDSSSFNWTSGTLFTLAIVTKIYAVAAATLNDPLAAYIYNALFNYFHEQSQYKAELAALAAASKIHQDYSSSPKYSNPNRTFALHLIGHSRGGYVASRTSQLLNERYGITACNVTTLDGYADDWPGISSSFADGSIVDTATALHGNNYLVEQDLLSKIKDTLAPWFATTLKVASTVYLPARVAAAVALVPNSQWESMFKRVLANEKWQAPARGGIFDLNATIPGTATDPSDHMDIHKLYFEDPQKNYILQSPVGNPKSCVAASSGASGEGNDTSAPKFPRELSQSMLLDLIRIRQYAQANPESLSIIDPSLAYFTQLIGSPGYLEEQLLGAKALRLESLPDGSAGIRLPNNATLNQPIDYRDDASSLQLQFASLNLSRTAKLKVFANDSLLSTFDLTSQSPLRMEIPNSGSFKGLVDVKLQLEGAGATDTVVLQTLRAVSSAVEGDFRATPNYYLLGSQTEVSLSLENVWSATPSPVQSVSFFLETNGMAGLQTNTDRPVVASFANNRWTATLTSNQVSLGNNIAYAVIQLADARTATETTSIEAIVAPSAYSNRYFPADVNRDGVLSSLDLDLLIQQLKTGTMPAITSDGALFDVNMDRIIDGSDAALLLKLSKSAGILSSNSLAYTSPTGNKLVIAGSDAADDLLSIELTVAGVVVLGADNSATYVGRVDQIFADLGEGSDQLSFTGNGALALDHLLGTERIKLGLGVRLDRFTNQTIRNLNGTNGPLVLSNAGGGEISLSDDWSYVKREIGSSVRHLLSSDDAQLYIENDRFTNPIVREDVNADGLTTPLDALLIVRYINSQKIGIVRLDDPPSQLLDTSGDNYITPLDALLVINALNQAGNRTTADGEAGSSELAGTFEDTERLKRSRERLS